MPLVTPWSKVNCPFCFARFHLCRARRRQIGPTAAQEPDVPFAEFFRLPTPPNLGKVDDPVGGLWRRLYVPREGPNERLVCPKCHIPLSDLVSSGEAKSEVIAVIGARNSGKSNFFGVLVNALRRRYVDEVGFALQAAETHGPGGRIFTPDLYNERYGKHLFNPTQPKAVPQTDKVEQKAGTRSDPRIPLIYQLNFRKRFWHYATRPFAHHIPVYFMIYDAAGEDMIDQAAMEQYYRFLLRATGIIFLIDPFDYPGIRAQLPEALRKRLPPPMPEPARVVDGVLQLYRGRGGYSASRKISVPVAFALTKSDLFAQIQGLLYSGSAIGRDSTHRGGFDQAGCEALSREVIQRIRDWDSPELVQKAESNFKHYSFFALSALGAMPKTTLDLEQAITPSRIADPLLWLLWQRGYIPAIRR